MTLSKALSDSIVHVSHGYLGRQFNWTAFNCVHFVREVYAKVGITLPMLDRYDFPPKEFHLSPEEFFTMPIGHSVFFRRKTKNPSRHWSHLAIIASPDTLIHCTRYVGNGVVITPKSVLLETYDLSPMAET